MDKFIRVEEWKNWYIQEQDDEFANESLKEILKHMLIRFEQDFGKELLISEDCYIYIDKEASCPMLVLNRPKVMIRLVVESGEYWAQVIYQLSHEICHYILRQASNKKESLKWFEETLCEAMAYYVLEFFKETWTDCLLSRYDERYFKSIDKYLENELSTIASNGLSECDSKEKLYIFNETCDQDRSSRINERNYIYDLFKKNRESIKLIAEYQKYVVNNIIIDFDKWEKDSDMNLFVKQLRRIQPNII